MNTITKSIDMLYCPKCKREYKDGVQRFCNNDGVRLLPGLNSGPKTKSEGGVFTSLLGRQPDTSARDEKIAKKPSRPIRKKQPSNNGPDLPEGGRVFATENLIKPAPPAQKRAPKVRPAAPQKTAEPKQTAPQSKVSKKTAPSSQLTESKIGKPVRKPVTPNLVASVDDDFELDVFSTDPVPPTDRDIEKNESAWVQSVERIQEPPVFENTEKQPKEPLKTRQETTLRSEPSPEPKPGIPPVAPVEKKTETFTDTQAVNAKNVAPPQPESVTVDPSSVARGTAEVGNRTLNPMGREAINAEDKDALLGETVKGRYRIVKTLGSDEWSITYLAEDKILQGKGAVVRVMLKSLEEGTFEDKIFHEERVSLSHVNHPNVAKVVDSGELQEGYPFIVTSDFNDDSVAKIFQAERQLNPMRIARIIQQASYALSEVHQNGILHRHLRPESILLTVSDAGVEQVKVSDFCISDGKPGSHEFQFMAPEQLGNQLPTFASDSYSLAVIAYRLLTQRMPFFGDTPKALIADQKKGLISKPSELNESLDSSVDDVLIKALSFDPSERYPKARDFGEALYDAISKKGTESVVPPIADEDLSKNDGNDFSIAATADRNEADLSFKSKSDLEEKQEEDADVESRTEVSNDKRASKDALWKQRSPEPVNERSSLWLLLPLMGILLFSLIGVGVWQYFLRTKDTPSENATTTEDVSRQGVDNKVVTNPNGSGIETPPVTRVVKAPEGFTFFENQKLSSLSPELVKKYQPFSVYYPEDWERKKVDKEGKAVDDMFLDVVDSTDEGLPIEQFSVTSYESRGTFKSDTNIFVKLVEKSNKDASESLKPASFRVVEQGATTIQNGRWKAYQVNFESKGQLPDGKPLSIWVRRLWIPVQRPGAKNGFVVTMLATSLSKDVKGPDDVGKKGNLRDILDTFEPGQDF